MRIIIINTIYHIVNLYILFLRTFVLLGALTEQNPSKFYLNTQYIYIYLLFTNQKLFIFLFTRSLNEVGFLKTDFQSNRFSTFSDSTEFRCFFIVLAVARNTQTVGTPQGLSLTHSYIYASIFRIFVGLQKQSSEYTLISGACFM